MHFLDFFYKKTLKFDLINKFYYTDLKNLPKLKKIILNFSCKTTELKPLATNLLALELITNQKGNLIVAKRPNLLLKIKKGNPVGCKPSLKKTSFLDFIAKNSNEIFSKIKDSDKIKINSNSEEKTFSFTIKNVLNFSELTENYHLFNNLLQLNFSFVISSGTETELIFLLNSLRIPVNHKINAGITQLVECNLAKIKAEGSNPSIC